VGKTLTAPVPCPVSHWAKSAPDRLALTDGDRRISYRELDRMIDAARVSLQRHDIRSGDVAAVLSRNSISYAVLLFAAFRSGVTLMPLNLRLNQSAWMSQMEKAHGRVVIVDAGYGALTFLSGVRSVRIDDIVSAEIPPRSHPPTAAYSLDAEALIIFSSGSAGPSRGVRLTWRNLYASALGTASVIACDESDCWLAVLPFYHVGGILIPFRTALAGCNALIMDRFDPQAIIAAAAAGRLGYLSVVPTMLTEVISADASNDLRHVKGIILGGAACPKRLRDEITARRLPVLTTYGMTETTSMVTLLPPADGPDKLHTAGKALPYRELDIVDALGEPVPPGQPGRIMVRGEAVFSRYLDIPQSPLTQDGWFDTGDDGLLDDEGYLTVIGRADSVIMSGGEKIDLNEIERSINMLDGVSGVVVMGIPDVKWGTRPVAFVELSDPQVTTRAFKEALAPRLPKIMIPDHIVIVDRLPLTGTGKYDRQSLRSQYPDLWTRRN